MNSHVPPTNPAFVLDNGVRVPLELRYLGEQRTDAGPKAVWQPIIEGDVAKLLPRVVKIEADWWPPGTTFKLPHPAGIDGREWARKLLENSPTLRSGSRARTSIWSEDK